MTDQPPKPGLQYIDSPAGYQIAYHSRQGKSPGVVFLGGFMSDMTGTKAMALDAHAAAAGRAFTRFDYGGHGASGGDFRAGTIGAWTADALAVIDAAQGPLILVGSSMGGWIATLAALVRPARVAGLIGVAAAPDFTQRLVWDALDHDARVALAREGAIEEPSPYGDTPQVVTHALVVEGRNHLVLDRPSLPIRCPVRLFHGLRDAEVPWTLSRELMEKVASADAVLTLIKDGDHRLSAPGDLARLTAAVEELAGG